MTFPAGIATPLNCDDVVRSRRISASFEEGSASGSPAFDILRDGWVSSFDEDGNFLEVSFEASPDNESALIIGGSGSEGEMNQHFFPRMSVGTSALSAMAPRISAMKNPMSTVKNPMSRFTKKLSEEGVSLEKKQEAAPFSSCKKRQRKKKLTKRISKLASKVVPKRTSEAPSNLEVAPSRSTNTAGSRRKRSTKKLKKKIMKRISKNSPLMRMSKIGRKGSAEGAFPSVSKKNNREVSSMKCAADSIRPRGVDEFNEHHEFAANMNSQHNDEVPANSTGETSDASCGDSQEEAFTPNMAETTTLYYDQRIPIKWGMKDTPDDDANEKKCLALDLGEPTDESLNNNNNNDKEACKEDCEKSISETFNGMHMQEQLDVFNADETLSCNVEELMNMILQDGESRQRARSACARTNSTEFADLKISCSNSTGGMVCPHGSRDDSMSPTSSTVVKKELLIAAATASTASAIEAQVPTTPLKTIVIRKRTIPEQEVSPIKSPVTWRLVPPQSPVGRTPSSNNNKKNGSAGKKQFNYRTNRKTVALTPTRLQMTDQAPSSPIGDLRKPHRRSYSLKKTIKRGIRSHPVASTTVALSAVLLFFRNFV
ncbi:unnamed protein product [Cylindrotheca closterium]|uniref:Uncharacterized protein n=1 Tax=Cylindrotheca closterium TaxID=2856 RepID=A0AAD2FHC8_9STRA|nr:unnamed protein product [Cylindrotheca closterium]